MTGLDVEIAGGVDGFVEFVIVAVGALGERLAATARSSFGTGIGGIELDDIVDIGELAVGFEAAFFGGFGERDVFDGAIFH